MLPEHCTLVLGDKILRGPNLLLAHTSTHPHTDISTQTDTDVDTDIDTSAETWREIMAGENAREMEKENARGQYKKKHIERGIRGKERCAWDGRVGGEDR